MPVYAHEQILTLGVDMRFNADGVHNITFAEPSPRKSKNLRKLDKIVHFFRKQIQTKIRASLADHLPFEGGIAIHTYAGNMNGGARGFNFVDDHPGGADKFIGQYIASHRFEIDAIRSDLKPEFARRVAESPNGTEFYLVRIQNATEQLALIEHCRRKFATDKHHTGRMR